MATSDAPVAVISANESRNCARCRRQNGQEKPRRKTRTTGPPARASLRVHVVFSPDGSEIAGAVLPVAALRDARDDISGAPLKVWWRLTEEDRRSQPAWRR